MLDIHRDTLGYGHEMHDIHHAAVALGIVKHTSEGEGR
jgi:hypothetical protein